MSVVVFGVAVNIGGNEVYVYGTPSGKALPIVYLNTFMHEGESVWNECMRIGVRRFFLVEICVDNWDDAMSPWSEGRLTAGGTLYGGKASDTLQTLVSDVIPTVESDLIITRRIIAGYSLAGLFALWSVYNTDVFTSVVSCSGSFWYPSFLEYATNSVMKCCPTSIYLSLGDKEKKTGNLMMRQVESVTQALADFYQSQGINTVFRLNDGNHSYHANWRVAKGIQWILRT